MKELKLRTIKKLSADTGASPSFIKQLLREEKLQRHYINSALFVSQTEFEAITTPAPKPEYLPKKLRHGQLAVSSK